MKSSFRWVRLWWVVWVLFVVPVLMTDAVRPRSSFDGPLRDTRSSSGLAGTLLVQSLYLVLLWRGVRIALAAPDPAHKMIAAGLTFVIVAQALMNMSIVLGLGPAKGTPLPLLSYGRSSLVCSLAAVGLLLHISQKRGDTWGQVKI